jgi:hypothetical protein
MGLDLTLLIVTGDPQRGDTTVYAHTQLDFRPTEATATVLFAVESDAARDVPKPFFSFLSRREDGERGYGDTQKTPYGEGIRMARARDFLRALSAHNLTRDGWELLAAIAYVEKIPGNTWVALYWH